MAQLQGRGAAALRRASGSGPNSGRQAQGGGTIESLAQLKDYLYSLTEGNFGNYGERFGTMTRGYLATRIKEVTAVASIILEAAMNSKETTRLGAMVCKVIIYPDQLPENEAGPSKAFRNTIVELMHNKYEERKE